MIETPILVQKFGGTSVATVDSRRQVVEHIRRAREAGYRVAIVVSAIGRRGAPYATDTLLDLLRSDGGAVDPRDYDLIFVTGEIISVAIMSQTLKRAGIAAVGLTGGQAGLHTDGHYREAEIVGIDVARLRRHMAAGAVPVITGGQGIDPDSQDYTTLGRGASDTSGVAFGVALGAEKVEIFTDVEGVAAIDPRMVPGAHWLARVSFMAMYELARFGAKVLHPRAILAGWRARTPVVVRSTFSTAPGTIIADVADERPIVGLATLSPMDTAWLPANAVDAEVHPVADDLHDVFLYGRVLEVEVGLMGEESVEVELAAHGVERPIGLFRVDEDDPDVRILVVGVAPDVVVAIGTLRIAPGLLEPFVLVGGVVERIVDHDAHVALVCLRHQVFELVQSAELGQDRVEVRDVVAAIPQW